MFYVGINLFVHCGSSKYLYALPAPLIWGKDREVPFDLWKYEWILRNY